MGARRILSSLLLVCVTLGACAPDLPTEPLATEDLHRACGNLRFDGPVDEELMLEPIPGDVKQILDAELERIDAVADIRTDAVQWYLASRAEDRISVGFKRPTGDEDSYTEGHLNLTEDGWRGGGWGPCEMRFSADDRQTLRWAIDGDYKPESQMVSVLAEQMRCASEPPLDASDIQPVVVSTAERVTVLLVAPLPPPADVMSCRQGGTYQFNVDLGEPLGDRELHDGGTNLIGAQRYPVVQAS